MAVPTIISLATAKAVPALAARESQTLFRHGTMELRWWTPPTPDDQTPHRRDELYVVAEGSGWFNRAGDRIACRQGDVLFVAAGVEHRFEDVSPEFGVWVMFWGPQGGEAS